MSGQRVVLLQVAERRLGAAERMRGHRRALAARVDAALGHRLQPGVVRPRLGPYPLGIATELPATGVALAHGSGSGSSAAAGTSTRMPPIAAATSPSAAKLWPLTSASQ